MFQPRVITGVVISGVVLQSPWLFLALSTVLWWSALVPRHNPFDAFFNHVMADPMRLAAMPAAPPPRRFAQAMAGTFAMSIAMTLFAGASHAAWLLEGVFVAASMSVVVRRLCLPPTCTICCGLELPPRPVHRRDEQGHGFIMSWRRC